MKWMLSILIAVAVLLSVSIWNAQAEKIKPGTDDPKTINLLLDFENGVDAKNVDEKYSSIGVSFQKGIFVDLSLADNAIYDLKPSSGKYVVTNMVGSSDITIVFNLSVTGPVKKFSMYLKAKYRTGVSAYDAKGNLLFTEYYNPASALRSGIGAVTLSSEIVFSKLKIFNADKVVGTPYKGLFVIDDFSFLASNECLLGVPLYSQYSKDLGAFDDYGEYGWVPDKGIANIHEYGCALVSAAMILSYYANIQSREVVTPRELNTWLRAHSGYSGGNILLTKVAEYARSVKDIKVWFNGRVNNKDNDRVNGYICLGMPVILAVYTNFGQHFVVATGSKDGTFILNDPAGLSTNLDNYYKNEHHSSRYLTSIDSTNVIEIIIHSPIELMVVDSLGRRSGKDGFSGHDYTEILSSSYYTESIAIPNYDEGSHIEAKKFESSSMVDGSYHLYGYGTGSGDYRITIVAQRGDSIERRDLSGVITKGDVLDIAFDYGSPDSSGSIMGNFLSGLDSELYPNKIYLPFISR